MGPAWGWVNVDSGYITGNRAKFNRVNQKKSRKGIATPQREIDLIKARLKRADDHYKANYVKGTRT